MGHSPFPILGKPRPDAVDTHLGGIEDELRQFEEAERKRLGLDSGPGAPKQQWRDANPQDFYASQRAHTTILVGGLTLAHDTLLKAGFEGIGYRVQHLEVPSNDALRLGKEFGNRGQCNPTYFTVGNLVKYLTKLRDNGMSTKEIVDKHVFMTAGACGPCRFGTYATEYRKALRDSGFDGFRVILFQQQGGLAQATGEELGMKFDMPFFRVVFSSIILGDVLNAIGYRMRPYEVEAGATDKAIEECKAILSDGLARRRNIVGALFAVRKRLSQVAVDRSVPKPKVAIIGEFWAMTTEGDGNYRMQRFLESEGAEVDVQLVTAWLLYMLWENVYDTRERAALRDVDTKSKGIAGVDVRKKLLYLKAGEVFVRSVFQLAANAMGLHGYHLADMDEVAAVSRAFYNNELRGGEGHMEVGKLILNVYHSKVNMTLSVKPFGCMPSSGVSDGIQTIITELFPEGIFLPIETSGDGAVNVQSRVQMMLFKARQLAQREVERARDRHGVTAEQLEALRARLPFLNHPLLPLPHRHGSSAANLAELAGAIRNPGATLRRMWSERFGDAPKRDDATATVNAKMAARRVAGRKAEPKAHAA
jgi:predicted nucleotide-binding protein (sugar kinase/HSP70/actin superfamily)